MRSNILTNEQKEGRRHSVFDLATGYPSFNVPSELEAMLGIWAREAINKGALANSGPWRYADYSVLLTDAITSILRVDRSFHEFLQVTFSGSIAVQRAIVACQHLAESKEKTGCRFVLVEPSVDFYRSLLNEFGLPFSTVVRAGDDVSGRWIADISERLSDLANMYPTDQLVLLIDSPSNPQGFVATESELRQIAGIVSGTDGIMIADHCFALAGVHDSENAEFVFRIKDLDCDWLAIWDTGKTFDLNGDKIASMISSNREVNDAVEQSLETIQVVPSQRSSMFFSQFLSHPAAGDMQKDLRINSIENLDVLRQSLSGFPVSHPEGGTFAVIDVSSTGLTSLQVRTELLRRGLAVSSGGSFYSDPALGNRIIRIALARPTDIFSEAMLRLRPMPTRSYR